jgi:molecular chaperone GrpE
MHKHDDDQDLAPGVHELELDGDLDPEEVYREVSEPAAAAPAAAPDAAVSAEEADYKDRYLRAVADLDNYRKRQARLQMDMRRYGHEHVMREFLPVLDNLERALDAAQKAGPELATHAQGLQMITQQLVAAFAKAGVVPVVAADRPFDPAQHEAISEMPSDAHAPNTVLHELERGYLLWDRLLRPARVVVSRLPDGSPAPVDAADEGGGDA